MQSKMACANGSSVIDFDDLYDSAIKGMHCRYFSKDLSPQLKEDLEIDALIKLPEDWQHTIEKFTSTGQSQFKLVSQLRTYRWRVSI